MYSVYEKKPPLRLPRSLASVLPPRLVSAVESCGAPRIEEIRLHANRLTTVTSCNRNYPTNVLLGSEEVQRIFQNLCNGSLYAYADTVCRGYLPFSDGIRVGVCGKAASENGRVIGVSEISGLIFRIPNPIFVNVQPIADLLLSNRNCGGILFFAPPGGGKTTVLRSLALRLSSPDCRFRTVVIDDREELTGTLNAADATLDLLCGYPRALGIEIAVRSMGAQLILCDEIGTERDGEAILSAANVGVPILATTHGYDLLEILHRPILQKLHRERVFSHYVKINRKEKGAAFFTVYPRTIAFSEEKP